MYAHMCLSLMYLYMKFAFSCNFNFLRDNTLFEVETFLDALGILEVGKIIELVTTLP